MGKPTEAAKRVMAEFLALTPDERATVACWFCSTCWEYVGPGMRSVCGRHTESVMEERNSKTPGDPTKA